MITKNLIKECARGSRDAQMTLYRTYSRVVYNASLRIVGNSQEAEEIMQDAFLKLFEKADNYIESWDKVEYTLRRIAINASIDVVRKRKGFFVEVENLPDLDEEDDSDLPPDPDIEQLQRVIKTLPHKEQALLALKFKEGLSHKEIAQQFQSSESAVKMLFMRAKKRILTLYNSTGS